MAYKKLTTEEADALFHSGAELRYMFRNRSTRTLCPEDTISLSRAGKQASPKQIDSNYSDTHYWIEVE